MGDNKPGRQQQRHRFAVEYIGRNQQTFEGRLQPGPYALFRRTKRGWKYLQSSDTVYQLVLRAKKYLRDMDLPEQKVLVSDACDIILNIETQHNQLQGQPPQQQANSVTIAPAMGNQPTSKPAVTSPATQALMTTSPKPRMWTQADFLAQISNPTIHIELIDAILRIDGVQLEFMNRTAKSKLPGYKVFLDGRRFLWVMVPSTSYPEDIYIEWQELPERLRTKWRDLWSHLLMKPNNATGSFVDGGILRVGVEGVTNAIQILLLAHKESPLTEPKL